MNLFNFRRRYTVLLVHLGDNFVEVGLVGLEKKKSPKLICSLREGFNLGEAGLFYALGDALHRLLHISTKSLHRSGYPQVVDHALVTLSANWTTCYTMTHKEEGDLVFDNKYLEEVLNTKEREFVSTLLTGYELVHSDIIKLFLNGYPAQPLETTRTMHVDMEIFLTTASNTFMRKVEKVIGRAFGLKRGIQFMSFPVVAFKLFGHDVREDYVARESLPILATFTHSYLLAK